MYKICWFDTKEALVTLSLVTVSLMIGLVFMQVGHGQILDFSDLLKQQEIASVVDYCFKHADRPNPVQDLLDKGLISQEYNDQTCESVTKVNNLILDYLYRIK